MPRICPQCSSSIDDDRNLCPRCFFGEALRAETLECASCHSELDEDARFCPRCGAMASVSPAAAGDPVRTALAAKLESQYRIVRLLGRGGMGAVYLARDLTLEREVAIKVIRTADGAREIYDRFRREAKTAAKLSHPNIVPLHAFGEVEGMPYFVMGYVRGESLADRLRRDGKLPEEEARRIFGEIAGALDHAHRQGIVHRDVKPDNVLLEDETGRAVLTDFGVAKAISQSDTLTQHGNVVGTPHYMSPEQASGRLDLDGRSDIYSLGVMAYAMVAGRLPFDAKTAAEVLTQHIGREPVPLRSLAPSLSDSIIQTIERCLAKEPANRWADARSLKLALGVTEAPQLPDALQAAEARGVPALAITWSLMLFFALLPQSFVPTGIVIGAPVTGAIIYLLVIHRLRHEGFSTGQSQRVIWREPAWWLWWYPRSLRRRGNVWDRLPASVRHARLAVQALVTYAFLVVANGIYLVGGLMDDLDATGRFLSSFRHHPLPAAINLSVLSALVIAWAALTVRGQRLLSQKGVAEADVGRVMVSMPPSRVSFWSRPHIAAILSPETQTDASPRSETPHDHMHAILRLAGELTGPLRSLGAEAAVAARQLVASIDDVDQEIASLARNIEAGEEERLVAKIAALPPSTAGADSAPMRVLFEKQLELIRELSGRIEEAKERRTRRVEMLRALALHVASLRARLSETPSELLQISDSVRSLCEHIGAQAMAMDQAMVPTASGEDAATIARG